MPLNLDFFMSYDIKLLENAMYPLHYIKFQQHNSLMFQKLNLFDDIKNTHKPSLENSRAFYIRKISKIFYRFEDASASEQMYKVCRTFEQKDRAITDNRQ